MWLHWVGPRTYYRIGRAVKTGDSHISPDMWLRVVNPVTENIVQQWESSQWFNSARYDYTHSGAFLDMGSGSPIDDLVESGTVRLLDWNDSMTDIQLSMRFVDKVQALSAVHKCYHSEDNYCSWYIRIKKKATHNRWEITRFVKEHTCLVHIEQNKHRNLSSKFISMSISHLVANDHEIPVLNIIQEVQLSTFTSEEAENCVHPFPTRIFNKFLRIETKSREHKVTTYNPQEGIYMVKSPIRVSGMGNVVYTLQLNNKSCSCGKWQTYTLPYSHVLAMCRENRSRTDTYVPKIYSRQTYKRTYQTNFHPILSENFWRDVNLTFYPPNMKKERDRK
ncbi:hypothetical protein M9H77_17296 [Catharanthus roseus]|uniref:Uncharacterized protein n=1 Tax=Catharanthus roseus TaxID=4058 RepID=A0ACC0B473_CATRO|nr:hypothetical protein M9H77_17296 [Catharanthus roseus]